MNKKLMMQTITKRRLGSNIKLDNTCKSLYERALEEKSVYLAKQAIHKWSSLSEEESLCMSRVLDLLDVVAEKGMLINISECSNFINEAVIPKVRDAKSTRGLVKARLGRFKTKITTKINNKLDEIKDTGLKKSITPQPSLHTIAHQEQLEKMVENCSVIISCDNILKNHDKLSKVYNIDRFVYENTEVYLKNNFYEFVSEFASIVDTYKMPFEHKYNIAIENAAYALSKYGIKYDTKDLLEAVTDYFLMSESYSNEAKLDAIIEKGNKCKAPEVKAIVVALVYAKKDKFSMNALEKLFIAMNKAIIAVSVTAMVVGIILSILAVLPFVIISSKAADMIYEKNINAIKEHLKTCDSPEHKKYLEQYLAKLEKERPLKAGTRNKLEKMKKSIKESKFLEAADLDPLDNYIKLSTKKDYDVFFDNDENIFTYDKYEYSSVVAEKATTDMSNKVKEIFSKFKLSNVKTPEALKLVLNKIFTNDAEQILTETPNILTWIFTFFIVLGTAPISVVVSAVAGIATFFLHMHLQRKQCKRIIEVYKNNKKKAEAKLAKTTNNETKQRIEAYIKQLDKDIKKLEDYYDDLLGEDEKTYDFDDNDDFNIDFNFDESVFIPNRDTFKTILEYSEVVDGIDWDKDEIQSILCNVLPYLHLDDVDSITEFAIEYPEFIDKEFLSESLTDRLNDLKKNATGIQRYISMDCFRNNIKRLKESGDLIEYNESFSLLDLNKKSKVIKEALYEYNYKLTTLNEMNFTNSIKLAIEGLKKVASNLSDKEKMMSATVDSSLDMMKDKMEKALTQENREAVIKGSILPPASKVIKLAITSGAAWLVHPALTVILLLGTFAVNAKIRSKERQLIYEELDVELQMVDKYIRIAEDKNDMKSLRELLKIKRKLQAQESRLKYKMNIEWNQKTQSNTEDRD